MSLMKNNNRHSHRLEKVQNSWRGAGVLSTGIGGWENESYWKKNPTYMYKDVANWNTMWANFFFTIFFCKS